MAFAGQLPIGWLPGFIILCAVLPLNTQSIPAVLHLFLTKNLLSDFLDDLRGIALTNEVKWSMM